MQTSLVKFLKHKTRNYGVINLSDLIHSEKTVLEEQDDHPAFFRSLDLPESEMKFYNNSYIFLYAMETVPANYRYNEFHEEYHLLRVQCQDCSCPIEILFFADRCISRGAFSQFEMDPTKKPICPECEYEKREMNKK